MKIIKNTPSKNGAFPPIQDWQGAAPPFGYLEISAAVDLVVFYEHNGFVLLDTDESGLVTGINPNLAAWEPWKVEQSINETAERRTAKLAELSAACGATIEAGVEVTLPNGSTWRYSLTEKDQLNLTNARFAVIAGATGFSCHGNGEPHRLYSALEIMMVTDAATAHVLYHSNYHSGLKQWIRRTLTAEELEKIYYGAELPADLAAELAQNLEDAANAVRN